jgi:hypothetical protein
LTSLVVIRFRPTSQKSFVRQPVKLFYHQLIKFTSQDNECSDLRHLETIYQSLKQVEIEDVLGFCSDINYSEAMKLFC